MNYGVISSEEERGRGGENQTKNADPLKEDWLCGGGFCYSFKGSDMTKKKIMVLIQSGPQCIWSGICELVFRGRRGESHA